MKRNKFSLSHYKLASMDMGSLVPIGWFEVLPGDTIQQTTSALVRAAPLVSPVMHPLIVRIHHWYVPYRLLWDSFEDFITGGPAGVSVPTFPTIPFGSAPGVGTLADYLGIPTAGTWTNSVSALPFRAYAMIFNENYRDEDLTAKVDVVKTSGSDVTTNVILQNCAWEKDYFTSARPWEQKGPAITIPIGNTAPVVSNGVETQWTQTGSGGFTNKRLLVNNTQQNVTSEVAGGAATNPFLKFGAATGLQADLSGASSVTVTALRQALALQRFEEARARYGSRYVEYLRYLGVRSSDSRLQRPEYLGGGKQTIQFSEVLQTGPSASPDQANTVGALKGHGIGALRSNRYRRFVEEHGLVMTLMSVRPKTMYMNGLERKWNRRTKEDFWQKELEHIGQQPILNKEIYAPHATPEGTFGFQDRYDDYRRQESTVSGEFRSLLAYWHMARDFGSAPALNNSFVSCVPTMRTFASSTTDPLYVMANHSIQARRLVSPTGKSYIF